MKTTTRSGKPSMSYNAKVERSLDCYGILMSQGETSENAYANVLKMSESARVKMVAENN